MTATRDALSGLDAVQFALERARAAGAHSADAVLAASDSLEVRVRGEEVDTVQQSRERTLGIRVFAQGPGGLRSAVTSSSDLSRDAVARLAEDSVAIARATAPDPSAGLPADGFASESPGGSPPASGCGSRGQGAISAGESPAMP